ncbi:MAG: branched-chain amino acid ABC transporter permease [Micromonosporaceae bacterium]|nr:branched-chain amino acid ABC transporter permease [Micromonosporaceae bacterium]
MTTAIEVISRGLGTGSIYALIALGFVIIYRATRVISFAQPALMLAGAVLVTYLVEPLGFYAAVVAGALGTALLALVAERVAVRPMLGRPVFTIAIITIGLDVVIRVIAIAFIGTDLPQVGDPWGLKTVNVFGAILEQRHIAMVLTTAALVAALFGFLRYTRIGLAMRAASFDQEAAMAQGVSVGAVFAVSWAIAGGLAAIGGVFAASGTAVSGTMWLIALVALPVIILGGLDSLVGALIAGLFVGVVQSTVAHFQQYFPSWVGGNVAAISPYVLMMVALLVRPYGLFGTREVERV